MGLSARRAAAGSSTTAAQERRRRVAEARAQHDAEGRDVVGREQDALRMPQGTLRASASVGSWHCAAHTNSARWARGLRPARRAAPAAWQGSAPPNATCAPPCSIRCPAQPAAHPPPCDGTSQEGDGHRLPRQQLLPQPLHALPRAKVGGATPQCIGRQERLASIDDLRGSSGCIT